MHLSVTAAKLAVHQSLVPAATDIASWLSNWYNSLLWIGHSMSI